MGEPASSQLQGEIETLRLSLASMVDDLDLDPQLAAIVRQAVWREMEPRLRRFELRLQELETLRCDLHIRLSTCHSRPGVSNTGEFSDGGKDVLINEPTNPMYDFTTFSLFPGTHRNYQNQE